MQIICTTTAAAQQVLRTLLKARLQPVDNYQIRPIYDLTPPITFTMLQELSHDLLSQIHAIPDTTIASERAT